MLEILQKKIKNEGLENLITPEICSFTALEDLQQNGPYDMIFSNFAGLNCTRDLDKVLTSFSVLLKPGGIVTLVILPKFCLLEFLLIFKGKFKTATRRLFSKNGRSARVEGHRFKCWYYNPSFIIKYLKKDFKLLSIEGLCTFVPPSYIENFAEKHPSAYQFLKAKEKVLGGIEPTEMLMMQRILPVLERGDSIIAKDLGKTEFDGNDLKEYNPTQRDATVAKMIYMDLSKANDNYEISNQDILGYYRGQVRKAEAANTPPQDFRGEIVQDNYNDINDRYYGNNDVMTGTPTHGTHCSGIIGAARNNGKGMNGIADNVKIMMVRAVPDGDEHDKDIANAIRYAVDNGAQVISMSFGKDFSPEKNWVDDAVRYAQSKDVLLVHAAGNDAKNIDTADNFPNPVFLNKQGRAKNFITVGASGDATNGGFTARFSNYGKSEVDVFAPGVNIYSTLPGGDKYGSLSGTSMAAPVVAGLGALIAVIVIAIINGRCQRDFAREWSESLQIAGRGGR